MRLVVKVEAVVCDTEVAWAAGFFDGEGTTSVLKTTRDKYSYLRMSLSQKNLECLERFHSILGVGKIYKSKTRDIYSWNCYKYEEVQQALDLLWPYLSEIKRQQATKAQDTVLENRRKVTL